jgi:PAT family beta-lactamase induction signal transducer AmpG
MNLLGYPSGRILVFGLLYFSEGAPIGLIWWAVPTLLRSEGVAVEAITFLTATLVLFWAFKFLWAPLIDTWRTERFGLRSWVFVAQLLMGASLVPLLYIDPVTQFTRFWLFLAVHSFSATIQDVAIDALAIQEVVAIERGRVNGAMQAGMLLGRSIFGGGALLVATLWGWPVVLVALVGVIWVSMLTLLFIKERKEVLDLRGSTQGQPAFSKALRAAWFRKETRLGLVFALVAGAGFEAVGGLAGPFLVDSGVSESAVGWFFGVPVIVAMITGGIVGGAAADRIPRVRSVALFLGGFVAMILGLAFLVGLEAVSGAGWAARILLTGMYLFVGLFTAASYALFMDLTDPRIGGTQFSAYMSATNACEAWSVWSGGQLVGRAGYPVSFATLAVVSLAGLPLLAALARRRKDFRVLRAT